MSHLEMQAKCLPRQAVELLFRLLVASGVKQTFTVSRRPRQAAILRSQLGHDPLTCTYVLVGVTERTIDQAGLASGNGG